MSGFTLLQGTDPNTGRAVFVLHGPEAGRAVVYQDTWRHVPHASQIWNANNDPWRSHTPQPLTVDELNSLTSRFI